MAKIKAFIDKDIFNSIYKITLDGNIIRRKDGYIYKPSLDNKGYLRVRLTYPDANSTDGRYTFKVHRLVAMFYLKNYSEELQVNHKNGIKTDNRKENLEMVTNRENVIHAWNVLDSTERRRKIGEITKKWRKEKKNEISGI